ncbi:MAG: HAMP domain-containing histidine kinase [Deltaproteobacteria bacterium]|nr:HAMP domain-containing histidine kinase [Deltaproteobacteria bacterium]MBW2071549.1 HAMP domain-containing histidine kinase [Deltaproteobacteria bacterium]
MQDSLEKLRRIKELAFMGKITAGLSHEIKNTLAIINESVGLMGDLLDMKGATDLPNQARLKRIIASIEEQVQRSGAIVKRLNQFAHSMDKPVALLDLNKLVLEVTMLAQRSARLLGVHLDTQVTDEPLGVMSDPFRIQYVIFGFIEGALQRSSPHRAKVLVACARCEQQARVSVTDQGSPEGRQLREQISTALASTNEVHQVGDDSELTLLVLTLAELGGLIEVEDQEETGTRVILYFPLKNPIK